jgi:hypothetical protein
VLSTKLKHFSNPRGGTINKEQGSAKNTQGKKIKSKKITFAR